MKKLIFTGCSYTYGAGIEREYPSETTTEFIPQEYKIKDCTYEQLEFIHQNRFSHLVANKFGTTDLNNGFNGGNISYALGEIKKHFQNGESAETIGAIIFQITNLDRGVSRVYSEKDEQDRYFQIQVAQIEDGSDLQTIYELVEEYGELENVIELAYENKLNDLVKSLKPYEDMGIPVFIIHWRDGHPQQQFHSPYDKYPNLVDKIEWLKDRLIPITYKDTTVTRFVDLFMQHKELIVQGVIDAPKFDDHATILGHQVLADSIYEYLKNRVVL
jgi:hypothetical protein